MKDTSRAPYNTAVILAYAALAIVFTYPLATKFTTHILGPPEDNLYNLWNLWWLKKSILEFHTHPYYTDYLFYPPGASLAFNTFSLFNNLFLGLPLQFFLSRIVIYNILILLAFILGGWGCYLLIFHLVENARAAFLGSLVFAFSPYHMAHAAHHLNISSIQFLPFFALYFLRLHEQPKLKTALSAGVFLALAGLCSWYYLYYLLMFSFIFIIYHWRDLRERSWRGWLVGTFLGSGILVLPFIYPMLKELYYGSRYTGAWNPEWFRADLLAFFVPPIEHTLARKSQLLQKLYARFSGNSWEATVYLGYTALGLSIYGVRRLGWRKTGFWVTSGLAAFLLALGPRLSFAGKIVSPYLYLPYKWIAWVLPILSIARVPSRFVVLVMLSLAVLSGYGWNMLEEKLDNRRWGKLPVKHLAWLIFMLLILAEFTAIPFIVTSPEEATQASFFGKLWKDDPEDFAVLELPLRGYQENELYMYRQTVHQKRLLAGIISRIPNSALEFIYSSPLRQLLENKPLADASWLELGETFKAQKIKYIVLNRHLFSAGCQHNSKSDQELYRQLETNFPQIGALGEKIAVYQVY